MSKPKLNLAQRGFDETLTLATAIKTALTGNANFTTPVPALASGTTLTTTAQTKLNEYTALAASLETKMAERDEAFDALRACLTQWAGYVEAASGGDAAKILSAGMEVRSDRTPPTVPAQVLNLVLTAGDFSGTLDVAMDPEATAKSYEVQTSADPMTETTWLYRMTITKSSGTLPGLTSGSKVWVRVRAIGAAGPGPWSDPAVKTVP